MGFVPWLASTPVLALEPAQQQKGSGEPLLLPGRLQLSWQDPKFTEHQPREEEMQLQRQQLPGPAPATPARLFSASGEEGKGKSRWQ